MKKILIAALLLLPTLLLPAVSHAEISVIVHPDNSSEFNADAIKRIFLGKSKSFPDGGKVTPVNIADSGVRSDFNKKALKKSSSQIKAYWSKLVFTGKGTPPKELSSNELLAKIAANPELIGYVESSQVTDQVKVVATY